MKNIAKRLVAAAATTLFAVGASVGGAQAAIINLGFLLDESGSVGTGNYNLAKGGLANALGVLLTDTTNQYRVGVVSFANGATTLVEPTIVEAGNLTTIKNLITSDSFSSGNTNTALAFDVLVQDFIDAGVDLTSSTGLINITTDGNPTRKTGTTYPGSNDDAAAAAALAALTAGWDSISAEAVGNNLDTAFLRDRIISPAGSIIGPTDVIPNPLVESFVLQVASFDDYEDAITAKIQRITTSVVPVPAALPLLLGGLGILGFVGRRRKQTSAAAA